jgi:phosphoribosylamine--glycine ligase
MITAKGPELIEYNVRFGDPECQVLMMRLKSDLLPILYATPRHAGQGDGRVERRSGADRGHGLEGLSCLLRQEHADHVHSRSWRGAKVFHAGTALKDGALVATGGRVLNVTATGKTVGEAQSQAYALLDKVEWDNGFCRRDIGWQAINREKA